MNIIKIIFLLNCFEMFQGLILPYVYVCKLRCSSEPYDTFSIIDELTLLKGDCQVERGSCGYSLNNQANSPVKLMVGLIEKHQYIIIDHPDFPLPFNVFKKESSLPSPLIYGSTSFTVGSLPGFTLSFSNNLPSRMVVPNGYICFLWLNKYGDTLWTIGCSGSTCSFNPYSGYNSMSFACYFHSLPTSNTVMVQQPTKIIETTSKIAHFRNSQLTPVLINIGETFSEAVEITKTINIENTETNNVVSSIGFSMSESASFNFASFSAAQNFESTSTIGTVSKTTNQEATLVSTTKRIKSNLQMNLNALECKTVNFTLSKIQRVTNYQVYLLNNFITFSLIEIDFLNSNTEIRNCTNSNSMTSLIRNF